MPLFRITFCNILQYLGNCVNFWGCLIDYTHVEVFLESFKLLNIGFDTVFKVMPELCISVLQWWIDLVYNLKFTLLFRD